MLQEDGVQVDFQSHDIYESAPLPSVGRVGVPEDPLSNDEGSDDKMVEHFLHCRGGRGGYQPSISTDVLGRDGLLYRVGKPTNSPYAIVGRLKGPVFSIHEGVFVWTGQDRGDLFGVF